MHHRGGPPGFLRVTSPTQLAFADYKGNGQMLSAGNLAANDRVALFLMDYPRRERLKILGRARVEDARHHPELVTQLAESAARGLVERLFLIDVLSCCRSIGTVPITSRRATLPPRCKRRSRR